MQRGEQLRFALLAFGVLIVITLIQLAITACSSRQDELPALIAETKAWVAGNATLLSFVVAVVAIVYFAILYFTSGWFSRWFARRLNASPRT